MDISPMCHKFAYKSRTVVVVKDYAKQQVSLKAFIDADLNITTYSQNVLFK